MSGRIKPPGLVEKGVVRPIAVQQRIEGANKPTDGALGSWKLASRCEDQAVMPTPTDDDGPMDLDNVGGVFGHQCSALSCGAAGEQSQERDETLDSGCGLEYSQS